MESQILIRGFGSVKSSSPIYHILAAVPCMPHGAREHSALVCGGLPEILEWPIEQLKGSDLRRTLHTVIMACD